MLLGKFGRRLSEFFYLCPKLCWRLAEVSFYGLFFSWRAGHLDQVRLLVWSMLPFWLVGQIEHELPQFLFIYNHLIIFTIMCVTHLHKSFLHSLLYSGAAKVKQKSDSK